MKKIFKVFVIILVIGLIGFLGYSYIANRVKTNLDTIQESNKEYTIEQVAKKEKIVDYVKGSGEVTSFNIKTLNSDEDIIKELYVKDGDNVSQKQKIMKVSNGYETKTITAPISGIFFEVLSLSGTEYTIYDTNDVGIEFSVDENDVAKLSIGQSVSVKIVVLNKEIVGTVKYVSKLPAESRYKVRVSIPYSEEIRFGYGASLKVTVQEKEVLTIPYSSIIYNDNKYYVLKKENKDAYEKREYYWDNSLLTEVQIGTINANVVEIVSGLSEGDIVMEANY